MHPKASLIDDINLVFLLLVVSLTDASSVRFFSCVVTLFSMMMVNLMLLLLLMMMMMTDDPMARFVRKRHLPLADLDPNRRTRLLNNLPLPPSN